MSTLMEFANQGYSKIDDFLDKDDCALLTLELKKLVSSGKTFKDTQSPLSEAVYGAPVFERALEQLLPNIELATGKKLLPTYAYARLYKTGEVLAPHVDRAACEISATINLGFQGESWPIFISGTELNLGVGDAAIYRGMDNEHYREEFKGEWQAQLFLHYVDANGQYSNQVNDGREYLSHTATEPLNYWFFADVLSKDACQKIIDGVEKVNATKAEIGSGPFGEVNLQIRDVNRTPLDVYKGIGATLAGMGMCANQQAWGFNITHTNQCEFLRYDKDGHYVSHVDNFATRALLKSPENRKLTVLAFLNDDFEGGQLYLQNHANKIYPPQKQGTVLVFPSFLMHGVEPVTSGVRRSIVTWLVGPAFK